MRIQGKLRLGYFPLPLTEARRIRACLRYPASPFSAIDPCIGDGAAFLAITGETCARRYGIELDAYRAEQAASVVDELIPGNCLDVHCPAESYGMAFLNPPYDWTTGETRSERTERVFLAHTYRWLKTGGVLVLVVPAVHVRECGEILASQFKATRIFRLTDPESVRYRQVVVLATRRSRREREQLRDDDIVARRAQFANIGGNYAQLTPLGDASTPLYTVPESGPAKLEYRGLPLDEIEDLLPRSSAYRQAARILFPQPVAVKGRPLTPLHGGHVGAMRRQRHVERGLRFWQGPACGSVAGGQSCDRLDRRNRRWHDCSNGKGALRPGAYADLRIWSNCDPEVSLSGDGKPHLRAEQSLWHRRPKNGILMRL